MYLFINLFHTAMEECCWKWVNEMDENANAKAQTHWPDPAGCRPADLITPRYRPAPVPSQHQLIRFNY